MSKKNPDVVRMWVKRSFQRKLKKKAADLDLTLLDYTGKLGEDANNLHTINKNNNGKKKKEGFRFF